MAPQSWIYPSDIWFCSDLSSENCRLDPKFGKQLATVARKPQCTKSSQALSQAYSFPLRMCDLSNPQWKCKTLFPSIYRISPKLQPYTIWSYCSCCHHDRPWIADTTLFTGLTGTSALSLRICDCLHQYMCHDEVVVVTRPYSNQKSWLYNEFHVVHALQWGPLISWQSWSLYTMEQLYHK